MVRLVGSSHISSSMGYLFAYKYLRKGNECSSKAIIIN